MSSQLLTTKLHPPPLRSMYVSRPRLFERLQEGSTARLIVVSAPAGFGKTTFICDWLSRNGGRCAWLSLDEEDNDITRFGRHLIGAFRHGSVDISDQFLSSIDEQPDDLQSVLTEILNEIDAGSDHVALVFDDYHVIRQPQIHDAIAYLAANLPEQLVLAILSRADPPLSVARFRGAGQLVEVRATDLSFTGGEAQTFFTDTMQLELDDGVVSELVEKTEGWAAGLQLAGLSLDGLNEDQIHAFSKAFGGTERYVLDYLIEEVLTNLSAEMRRFVLSTSVVDSMCADLCNTLMGDSESGAASGAQLLEELGTRNIFLVPLDANHEWYRYHHLFLELLRNRLHLTKADAVPGLHKKASAWFESKGMLQEAIAHSISGRDFEKAAELAESAFLQRMSHGEDFGEMLRTLDELPEDIIAARPRLAVWHAWMLIINVRVADAEERLGQLEVGNRVGLSADLQGQMDLVRAEVLRHRGELVRALEINLKVCSKLDAGGDPVQQQQLLTGVTFNLAWTYHEMGNQKRAEEEFRHALAIAREAGSTILQTIAVNGLVRSRLLLGELSSALDVCREMAALTASSAPSRSPNAMPYLYVARGLALRAAGCLEEAASDLINGIELNRSRPMMDDEGLRDAFLWLSEVRMDQSSWSAAGNALLRSRKLCEDHADIPKFAVPVETCDLLLQVRKAGEAGGDQLARRVGNWAESRDLSTEEVPESLDRETEFVVWCRSLVAIGCAGEALAVLGPLISRARAGERLMRVAEMLLLSAIAYLGTGDSERARDAVAEAISVVAPERYAGLFASERELMPLLESLAADECQLVKPMMEQIRTLQLSGSLREGPGGDAPAGPDYAAPFDHDTLSGREREVLRQLARGSSGPQIAESLFVSVNTIKTHIKNIYAKLNVHSRHEAVTQARELNLLS